jgi:hypothetical protein
MTRVLAGMRLTIEIGWLVPLSWMIKAGGSGWPGGLMPVHLFLLFGFAVIFAWPVVVDRIDRIHLGRVNLVSALLFTMAAAIAVLVASKVLGAPIPLGTFLLDWIGLIGVVLLCMRIGDDSGYEDMLGDFRLGLLCLVFALGFAYLVVGHRHVTFTGVDFAGVVGYTLFGVFSLAFARSFALDYFSADKRKTGIELEWIVGMIALLGGLLIVSLVLSQLFAFDIVGALGVATEPLAHAAQRGLLSVLDVAATIVFNVLNWLVHLLGIHPPKQVVPPRRVGPPGRQPRPQVHVHKPPKLDPMFILAAKIAAILAVGLFAIGVLSAAFRRVSIRHAGRILGERRISGWSWRKMLQWSLFRGRTGVTSLVPHRQQTMRKPRRMRSVRDVYRSLLVLGRERARPKTPPETGLEYGRALNQRWPPSSPALDHLNALYMAERYGNRPVTSETLREAIKDLHEVEAAAKSVPKP